MDSIQIADFLFPRIQETILYRRYIKIVKISYEYDETYGNRYIRLSYRLRVNENFKEIPFHKQRTMFRGSWHYIFSLSSHVNRFNDDSDSLRFLEFKYIYESLTSYAVLQFEKYLTPGTAIQIKGIDLWPEANHAKKNLQKILPEKKEVIQQDIFQWKYLHELNKTSQRIYRSEKNRFTLTDTQIQNLFDISSQDTRRILINHHVPIKAKGIQTIDEVIIHTSYFAEALKEELNREYLNYNDRNKYCTLINYLYEHYLLTEKVEMAEQLKSDFLKKLDIQKGDILELDDQRIVTLNALSINDKNAILVEYAIIKNDLQTGQRTRMIPIDRISYVLKESDYLDYLDSNSHRYLSLFEKWMQKRKIRLKPIVFEPIIHV